MAVRVEKWGDWEEHVSAQYAKLRQGDDSVRDSLVRTVLSSLDYAAWILKQEESKTRHGDIVEVLAGIRDELPCGDAPRGDAPEEWAAWCSDNAWGEESQQESTPKQMFVTNKPQTSPDAFRVASMTTTKSGGVAITVKGRNSSHKFTFPSKSHVEETYRVGQTVHIYIMPAIPGDGSMGPLEMRQLRERRLLREQVAELTAELAMLRAKPAPGTTSNDDDNDDYIASLISQRNNMEMENNALRDERIGARSALLMASLAIIILGFGCVMMIVQNAK